MYSVNLMLGGTTGSRLRITGECAVRGLTLHYVYPSLPEEICDIERSIIGRWLMECLPDQSADALIDWSDVGWSSEHANRIVGPLAKKELMDYIETSRTSSTAEDALKPQNAELFASCDEDVEEANTQSVASVFSPLARTTRQSVSKKGQNKKLLPYDTTKVHPMGDGDCASELVNATYAATPWYALPGATTLNLPVITELVRWHTTRRQMVHSNAFLSTNRVVQFLRSSFLVIKLWLYKMDAAFVRLQLWGIQLLMQRFERYLEPSLNDMTSRPVRID